MKRLAIALTLIAGPALAAGDKPFFSLANTDFIVTIAFFCFIGVLFYFGVPGMLGGMLDKRADGIRDELNEARKIREEAQSLLASFERQAKEMDSKAEAIVEQAKSEARAATEAAMKDIEVQVARRLQAAEDKIASAEASAVKTVRDQAVDIAVAAATQVMSGQVSDARQADLIDEAIATVDAKLH